MAHYHKSRGQQAKKWERFKQRYGMSASDWRALKKSDPTKAHQVRTKAESIYRGTLKSIKVKDA